MTRDEIVKKIEELKNKKNEAELAAQQLDDIQHADKIFLNSVYGFCGTQYSPVYNKNIAESVTLTGQAGTKEMVKFTNKCLNALGKTDQSCEWVIAGDTDSVVGDSKILFDSKDEILENIFKKYESKYKIEKTENGTDVLIFTDSHYTESINGKCKIKNISRHKVNKDIYQIKTKTNELKLTEDHSVMVYRNGYVIECKPTEILKTDYFIEF